MALSEIIKDIALFRGLSREALADIEANAPYRISKYKEGDIVVRQGEEIKSLLILIRGRAKAEMENETMKRLSVDSFSAPEVLAPAFLFSSKSRYPVSIEAIEEAEFLFFNKNYFSHLMSREASIMQAFIRDISDKMLYLSQKLNSLGLDDLRTRIIKYVERHANKEVTQEEMALALAVARPSLSRVLSALIEEGLIIKKGHSYHLNK